MLIARCAQRLSCLVHRRHINMSNRSLSVWNNVWRHVKGFLTESEKENFDEECIRKAYRSDELNEQDWFLIYRDQGASKSFLLVSTVFPALVIVLGVIGYDSYNNDRRNQYRFVQRLKRDVEEVGFLAILPGTAVMLVVLTLLRMHQLRIIRIYQNRKNFDEYLAIGSRYVIQKHQMNFNRDCASACYFAEEQKDFSRLLVHAFIGNMQIEERRFLISDDAFRANNYRTYMLNETSIPPRL